MKNRRVLVALLSVVVLAGVSSWSAGWFKPTETTIHELAPGVYFRKVLNEPEFIGCNQGWVIFKDFVLVIDANFPNQAEEVVKLIRKTTDKPIRYVFDTHYHGDHADGNAIYTKLGAIAIASENSRDLFDTKASPVSNSRRWTNRTSTASSSTTSHRSTSRRSWSSTTARCGLS